MNHIMQRVGRGIFTAYILAATWAGLGIAHTASAQGGGFGIPPVRSYWIVPEFIPTEPLVWWEIAPNRWINAAPYPTPVGIGGGEVMMVNDGGVIHHDPYSCRAQCAPNECAECMWHSGICWVRCDPYAPWNPAQWDACFQTCSIDPGTIVPTDIEPSDLDDDKGAYP